MSKQETQTSDYRIRKLIGILGLSLPFILPISGGEFLSSISHYYYLTLSSLLFIIILSSFGLFLISYKGYKIDPETEKVSDDLVTNIAGLAALIVVFIPTSCLDSASDIIAAFCNSCENPLFGHTDKIKGTIHLISAGVFIFSMGWMSKYKFTRSDNQRNNRIYRFCGNIVWSSIGVLIILVILEKLKIHFWMDTYYVFILETCAIIPFGVSWLIKGKVIEDTIKLKNKFIKK